MKLSKTLGLVALIAAGSVASTASAAIVGLSGNVAIAGFTNFSGNVAAFENDNLLYGKKEAIVTLGAPLAVDATAPGLVPPLAPGFIPGQMKVQSHIFQFDQTLDFVGDSATVFDAEITFAKPVLGVIVTAAGLDATDALFNPGGFTYATGKAERGLGDNGAFPLSDAISFAGNKVTISLASGATITSFLTDFDQFRVITAIPLPAASWMGLGLLAGLGIVAKIRKARQQA